MIDLDGIGQRILGLPVSERNIAGLMAGKANTLFIAEAPLLTRAMPSSGPTALTIQKYDLEKRKLDKVVDSVNAFDISANGEKMLFRQGQSWFIAATAQPVKPGEAASRPTTWRFVLIRPRSGTRCTGRSGVSSATSSTTPATTASI